MNEGWREQAGRKGGKRSTPAKRRASRENGKLGGRPTKETTMATKAEIRFEQQQAHEAASQHEAERRAERTRQRGLPEYLASGCTQDICRQPVCPERIKKNAETGRWFITINHPGFNSPANNRAGYASFGQAHRAHRRYNQEG